MTGGAGFIGAHVVRQLVGRRVPVRVFDAFDGRAGDPDARWRAVSDLVRDGAIELEVGDVRDPVSLGRAFRGIRRVVHLAAATGACASPADSAYYADVNGVGSVRLLEAAVLAGVEHVVLASSAGVYGRGVKLPASEEAVPGAATSAYALSKQTMESAGAWLAARSALRVTCVRIFSPYGPGQVETSVVARLWAALSSGAALPIRGRGDARRSFTWVGDTASGVVAALGRSTGGFRVYNLAHARAVSVLELASLLRQVSGIDARIEHIPAEPCDHDTEEADVTRAREELGFVAATSLLDGVRSWLGTAVST